MNFRHSFALFFCALSATLIFSGVSRGNSLDDQIAEQQRQLALLNQRVKYHSRELAQAQKKEKGYLKELSFYDHRAKQTEEEVALLDLQIKKNENELRSVGESIKSRNAAIAELQEALAERCVAIYKYGGAADLNVLLSAQDLAELNAMTYLLNRLSREDEKNITALENEKIALKNDELKLQQVRDELGQRSMKRKRDLEANRQASAQRRELLVRIDREKQVHQAAMRENEEAQRELQKKIDDYIRRKALEAKEAQRNGQKKTKQLVHRGKFDWPVTNHTVVSRFGTRVHPKFKTKRQHTGIDIASPHGAPITTAGAGEVIFAGWMRGYGQVIIIDHGSGYATVYAHMSKILVDDGQAVKKGALIGRVGQTGVATGPHLHFEVRVNGVARNPLSYL